MVSCAHSSSLPNSSFSSAVSGHQPLAGAASCRWRLPWPPWSPPPHRPASSTPASGSLHPGSSQAPPPAHPAFLTSLTSLTQELKIQMWVSCACHRSLRTGPAGTPRGVTPVPPSRLSGRARQPGWLSNPGGGLVFTRAPDNGWRWCKRLSYCAAYRTVQSPNGGTRKREAAQGPYDRRH